MVGAALWWFVRSLGVRLGTGLSAVSQCKTLSKSKKSQLFQILPFAIPFTYLFLLPRPSAFTSPGVILEHEDHADVISGASGYAPVRTNDEPEEDHAGTSIPHVTSPTKVALSAGEKWILLKPLLLKYMLPLSKTFAMQTRLGMTLISFRLCLFSACPTILHFE